VFFVYDGNDGVVLQFLHSFRGFWKFWYVGWGVDFWEWSMKEVLVGLAYDLWK
jgi:hypothetical protein